MKQAQVKIPTNQPRVQKQPPVSSFEKPPQLNFNSPYNLYIAHKDYQEKQQQLLDDQEPFTFRNKNHDEPK